MTKVSVVTVVYNAEKEIEKTIESVLAQNYENLEYIIVDGLSKDGTGAIINKYLANIDCFISEKDNGIYDAMNKALKLVSGEWVIFLNAGDVFFSSNSIETVFKGLTESELEEYCLIGGDVLFSTKEQEKVYKVKNVKERWICMPACHQSLFIKSSVHKQYPYNLSYKICADHELFIKLYERGYRFLKSNNIVSVFKYDGLSATNRIDLYLEKLKIAKIYNAPLCYISQLQFIILKLKIAKILRNWKVMS
ncbi:glycosyltransferase family 2 protein [Citrobacter sedlakii]|uniref:glycosyltransferase family 2 protein n=1 Tax=Citrobacter sedlakii TaxID=67826 RepID=UPI003339B2D5